MSPIKILIVDDHPIVRDGLHGVFASDASFEVVGEAGNGIEALRRLEQELVDVVLMDLRMPEMGGVEAIGAIRERWPSVRALVLTTFDTDSDVLPAIEAGAIGYLLKDSSAAELKEGVRAAYAGRPMLAPSVAGRLMGQVGKPAAATLSPRETEVLRLIADGSTNRQAAEKLYIGETTIKTHLLHVYEKLGVRDRAAAVGEAYKRGLLG
ncbi:LuxR family two component transcriptional regulator [Antricoccus suffuscus]|uniref:LuxR family two component transcriptional regulator n=1 Tax=Antricoccus suffuscus TaxID=1629062 RepID=A0A2T1A6C5_9ACTN|nr:response regulator transcription factor [Antricoccus suffuscus]PRZ44163.1 LuxR family two component transcriptional regulator [Antricoccus suffuscus]